MGEIEKRPGGREPHQYNIAGWRGRPAGDLSVSDATLYLPLGLPPLRAVAGPRVALSAADLSFPGGGLGAHFRVSVLPAGEIAQDKSDDTLSWFLNAYCYWRQHRPGPHLWSWV